MFYALIASLQEVGILFRLGLVPNARAPSPVMAMDIADWQRAGSMA
jgi:hypothetical protein